MVDDFDVKLVHDVASKYNIAIDCTLPDLKMLFGDDVCVNSVLREPRCRPKMTGNNDLLKCNAYSIEDLCANCESFYVERAYSTFCNLITPDSSEPPCKYTVCKRFHKPWWSRELAIKRKQVKNLLHKWLKRRINENRVLYKEAQRDFDRLIRYSKRNFQSTQRLKTTAWLF